MKDDPSTMLLLMLLGPRGQWYDVLLSPKPNLIKNSGSTWPTSTWFSNWIIISPLFIGHQESLKSLIFYNFATIWTLHWWKDSNWFIIFHLFIGHQASQCVKITKKVTFFTTLRQFEHWHNNWYKTPSMFPCKYGHKYVVIRKLAYLSYFGAKIVTFEHKHWYESKT